jgi:hypothetical protein
MVNCTSVLVQNPQASDGSCSYSVKELKTNMTFLKSRRYVEKNVILKTLIIVAEVSIFLQNTLRIVKEKKIRFAQKPETEMINL